ncbi:hypothetical protein OJF2_52910 [Aquisphaera giovannonii]|uniref:Tetratricopeptide repeat protein n=1 Tax=Aquisphaera giovannonii TaxID=406548 RepID=A0A5B9W7P9_9BACT|nr:tetratricopeptide repeat protein [Aquisphaera giovannonii]QEH36706.1 hypothetical protein OJF2_52910 [Aquisphaera giovannonii]
MAWPGSSRIRWRSVLTWAALAGGILVVAAGLASLGAWLPLIPRPQARRLTELLLRSVLVGYFSAAVLLPTVLVLAASRILRRRRRGLSSPLAARLALASASGLAAIAGCELLAAGWSAWAHRMPRLPTTFPRASRPGELSLVVIGGSTALGYPYDPKVSIGRIVANAVEDALPGTTVELDMRAKLGANLEDMHKGLTSLARRPDAILISCGHNEYLSRFATSRDAGFAEAPAAGPLRWLYGASLRSPFCRWVYEAVRLLQVGGPPPLVNRHQPIDPPMFTPSEHRRIVEEFRRRLEALVDYCECIGAVPILMIPPGNESGFEPNRSVLPDDVTPAERERLAGRLLDAREIEDENPDRAVAAYRGLLEDAPDFAEAHFRLARLLERARNHDEARGHYIRARDLDGFPVRCQTELARVYREVAARHSLGLIDGPECLRPLSAHGILDDTLFHDAHHYTLRTQVALAAAVFDALAARGAFGLSRDAPPSPRDDDAVRRWARRLGVDDPLWATVCARTGTYYMHLASARFDPAERERKRDRFFGAAGALKSGSAGAETLGLPGVGTASAGPFAWDWWRAGDRPAGRSTGGDPASPGPPAAARPERSGRSGSDPAPGDLPPAR